MNRKLDQQKEWNDMFMKKAYEERNWIPINGDSEQHILKLAQWNIECRLYGNRDEAMN